MQGGECPPSYTQTIGVWSLCVTAGIRLCVMEALDMRVTQFGFWTTLTLAMLATSPDSQAQQDPGPRPGEAAAGGMLSNLSKEQQDLFDLGLEAFNESEGIGDGFGPRFNLNGCGGCHAQPAVGGTSPETNPQVALATQGGARNRVPPFITSNGPIREVRFRSDGQVHALFIISGRVDETGEATTCNIRQERFSDPNIIFRIPTPLFGSGLIEQIPDSAIRENRSAHADDKQSLGILGKEQEDALQDEQLENTLGRFGWKAQHVSLRVFSGEAYNVEMGITNELFPTELEQNADCQYTESPNSPIPESGPPSDVDLFAAFMRGLAPPTARLSEPGGAESIARGFDAFGQVECALCHTPDLAGVPLHSDLLLHSMGAELADGITQGNSP